MEPIKASDLKVHPRQWKVAKRSSCRCSVCGAAGAYVFGPPGVEASAPGGDDGVPFACLACGTLQTAPFHDHDEPEAAAEVVGPLRASALALLRRFAGWPRSRWWGREVDVDHDTPAAWVERNHRKLEPAEVKLVNLVSRALRVGAYDVSWRSLRGDAREATVTLHRMALSTFGDDALTRLVIGAHDLGMRLAVTASGVARLHLRLTTRTRTGGNHERHPTIEQALADWRAHSEGRP